MEGATTETKAEKPEPEQSFYRPTKLAAAKELTTEELRERLALTKAIRANLQIIAQDENDLDKLAKQTADIVANLREIGADATVQELETER
ncbi:MAG: hypothetical protein WAN65_23630 [Candidatus Sulfotelmatobacter sp.]